MKKFLLAIAACGLMTPAFAQEELAPFAEFFTIGYEGQTLESGATVNITKYEQDDPEIFGEGVVTYTGELSVENEGFMPQYIHATYNAYQPTAKEYLNNRLHWGEVQLCYSAPYGGNCLSGNTSSILGFNFADSSLEVPLSTVGKFEFQLHVLACDQDAEATYLLTLQAVDLPDPTNENEYMPVSEPFNLYINFSEAAKSGVANIEATTENGVYYDLQGRKVENPSKGIYIYRQGNKTVKKIVK